MILNSSLTSSDSAYTSFQWASFSSDGSKYVHWFGGHIRELQVFDFDRCSGELSNLQTYDFSDIVIDEWFTDFTPFSLSPDGTKLYMVKTNSGNVLRFGELADFEALTFNLVLNPPFGQTVMHRA